MFSTVIKVLHSDARQLSNSARTLITDSNTQQMLPAGTASSMILVGIGDAMVTMIETLKMVDSLVAEESRRSLETLDIIAVTQRDAEALAALINSTNVQRAAPQQPHQRSSGHAIIVADPHTNSLLVKGTAAELDRMRDLVARLDAPTKK